MENAVDALKVAFSVFVFSIALALSFSVVGQARATSDMILSSKDKTSDYEYIANNDINANNKERIVGFETILPAIYRYAEEQYAVTIVDNSGKVIVRYDLYTEGFMNEWNTILKQANRGVTDAESRINELKTRIEIVDSLITEENESWINSIWNSLITGSRGSYSAGNLYQVENYGGITVGAPWGSNKEEILKRIKCDLSSSSSIYTKDNIIKYKSKNLNQYKDKKFKEKFVEIQTSGTTITETDDKNIEYSLETVKGNKKLEIVYIMQ